MPDAPKFRLVRTNGLFPDSGRVNKPLTEMEARHLRNARVPDFDMTLAEWRGILLTTPHRISDERGGYVVLGDPRNSDSCTRVFHGLRSACEHSLRFLADSPGKSHDGCELQLEEVR